MRISKSTNINASTTDVLEPTVDNVLNLIENKKIIFKNDVAYWSRGKKVLPKEYRDCIEQTQYAHWINEWSCEQAEKFGDRAYYDYDGDTEVKATNMRITKATKTSVKASTQSSIIYDKNGIVVKKTGRNYDFIATIENNTDDVFCINTYDPSCDDVDECNVVVNPHDWIGILADDEGYAIVEYFEKLGGVMASKKLSTTDKALQHIKAAIDILGKSGNKDDVTKDSIANLATVMFDIKGSSKVTATADKKSCKYSKKECIDAIQYSYGFNKKEAENYYRDADCKLLETLVDGFKGNAKKTFYND